MTRPDVAVATCTALVAATLGVWVGWVLRGGIVPGSARKKGAVRTVRIPTQAELELREEERAAADYWHMIGADLSLEQRRERGLRSVPPPEEAS